MLALAKDQDMRPWIMLPMALDRPFGGVLVHVSSSEKAVAFSR